MKMPDTWVTDLKHFLNANGSIAPPSGPARKLAEHITAIVVELTAELYEVEGVKHVACRRRPSHRPCKGKIESWIEPKTGVVAGSAQNVETMDTFRIGKERCGTLPMKPPAIKSIGWGFRCDKSLRRAVLYPAELRAQYNQLRSLAVLPE